MNASLSGHKNGLPSRSIRCPIILLETSALSVEVFAELFNYTYGCPGVGCQKHVRGIQPLHFATGQCRDDFVYVPFAHQAIRTPI